MARPYTTFNSMKHTYELPCRWNGSALQGYTPAFFKQYAFVDRQTVDDHNNN